MSIFTVYYAHLNWNYFFTQQVQEVDTRRA